MAICAGCGDCYACRLRAKDIGIASAVIPNRLANTARRVAPRTPDPAWERGVAGEHRRDGSFMPYLAPGSTRELGVKEFADNRGHYEAQIARLKSDPNVFKKASDAHP